MILGLHVNQDWADRDGNGHYWPAQPPGLPPSFYPTPADPLVSPNFEGWWQRSFALAGRIWKPALKLQAILVVPMAALTIPASLTMTEQQEKLQQATAERPGDLAPLADFMTAAFGSLGLTFAVALISVVATAITAQMVVLAATGQPVGLKAAAGTALRRAHAVVGWQIVATLLACVSVLACFLPVIYVAAVIMILPVVVTLERGTGIGRCFSLFNADLGTSVSRIATIFGLNIAASIVLGVIGVVLEVGIGGTAGSVVASILSVLYYLPAGVFLPPLLVTAYADMRARREPFSTAYLAPPPAPAPQPA